MTQVDSIPWRARNLHEKTGLFEKSAGSGGAKCGAPGAGNSADNPTDDVPDDPARRRRRRPMSIPTVARL
jgi:hypothetical protein